jgi:hypothetical protein
MNTIEFGCLGTAATSCHQGEGEGEAGSLPEAEGPRQGGQDQDQGEGEQVIQEVEKSCKSKNFVEPGWSFLASFLKKEERTGRDNDYLSFSIL